MKLKHYKQSIIQKMGKLYEKLYKENNMKGLSLIDEILKFHRIHIINRGDGIIIISNEFHKVNHIRNINKRR